MQHIISHPKTVINDQYNKNVGVDVNISNVSAIISVGVSLATFSFSFMIKPLHVHQTFTPPVYPVAGLVAFLPFLHA